MREFVRPLLTVALILLVPVLPFLLFGEQCEAWIQAWTRRLASSGSLWMAVVCVLSLDIFLPVPSSFVSTLAGAKLGTPLATLASWLGLSIGACLGFALARRWGKPIVARFSSEQELVRVASLSDRLGPAILAITRGIPILAEASVLMFGTHRLAWRSFLPPVLLSNLGIALAYAAFGSYAQRHAWLAPALGISLALPILCLLFARRLSLVEPHRAPSDRARR